MTREAHPGSSYTPLTIAELGELVTQTDDDNARWRLVAEFLEEYRWEPADEREKLLTDMPAPTGDERWDALLAALAEYVASRDGRRAPGWTEDRVLEQFWFPFNTAAARVDAFVHAPAAFRRRGVFVADHDLGVA